MTPEEWNQVKTPALDTMSNYKSVASMDIGQGPYRAAHSHVEQSYEEDFRADPSGKKAPQVQELPIPTIRPKEVSLMNLPLQTSDFAQLVEAIEPLPQMDPMFDLQGRRAIGNYFFHGNHCEFLMAMYVTEAQEPLLDFRRMSGDGFVMDAFFREVKNLLEKHEYTVSPTEDVDDEEESHTFNDYSEDETETVTEANDIGELLKNGGFLQLQYDKMVVNNWLDKIGKGHIQDKNYLMGLLAHNSKHDSNREIIISQGGAGLLSCLEKELTTTESAAMIRNAALLTKEVLPHMDFQPDFVKYLLFAMGHWVPGNRHKQTLEVTESREAVAYLSMALLSISGKVDLKTIQQLAREAFTEERDSEEESTLEVLTKYIQGALLNKAVDPERKAGYDFALKVLSE